MKVLQGIPASGGIAIGSVSRQELGFAEKIPHYEAADPQAELSRLDEACRRAKEQLEDFYRRSLQLVAEKNSMIFQIHIAMLQDEEYLGEIRAEITDHRTNAEYAVSLAAKKFYDLFSKLDDAYMRARCTDVVDVSNHLLYCLDPSLNAALRPLQSGAVIAVSDLMPSHVVQADRRHTLAFLSRTGTRDAHASILLRDAEIPAVVGLGDDFLQIENGCDVIVDGFTGEVILQPDEATCAEYWQRLQETRARRKESRQFRKGPSVTKDGRRIAVCANISNPSDVESVLRSGADGIGLFRTEYLYMSSSAEPSEEQQFQAYKSVLERMEARRVVVRTLDLGEEPVRPYFNLEPGSNPAMGYRAIRFSLDRSDLFLTQLRALLRASIYGRLAIMFPIVTSQEEIILARHLVERAREELTGKGIPVSDKIEIGVLIETPSAAVISDLLAPHADFFSIGTNDLTQYILAADRKNPYISHIYNPRHPAVLRMIKLTVDNARSAGIWTAVCGESASDPALTNFYLSIGVEQLSVAPAAVLELRRTIQSVSLENPAQLIERFLAGRTDLTGKGT